MLLRTARTILSLFLLIPAAAACGFSSDPQLLQLVPPESQIIARMRGHSTPGQLSSVLLVTRNNELDHEDFLAIVGGDASRSTQEVVFVAAAGPDGTPSEHSLLVSGHFNRDAIFRPGNDSAAGQLSYRGVAILAVPPFARGRGSFHELRWLAIPTEHLAIFGSIASVRRELDRWTDNSPTDPEILERLSRLDPRDDTWCLLPAPRRGGMVASILRKLDPKLGILAEAGGSIQYGIRFAKDVEITASTNPAAETNWQRQAYAPGFESMAVSSFLSASDESDAGVPATVRVKIRRRVYERHLADFKFGGPVIESQPFH